jgi:aldehyde:ferredoxin oxidoreductase
MTDYGYAGGILIADATTGTSRVIDSAPYTRKHIGGQGLAARLYWELVPPEADAFDAENAFIAASGPVAGFPGFAGYRWKIYGKSPAGESNLCSYANLGERFGAWLKAAGYDALVIVGKASAPCYLCIDDDTVEFRDAAHLRGLSTFETTDALAVELGEDFSVMTIGPAGENLIPFATVLSDGRSSGAGGLGAVLGAKNVKAVAARGSRRPVAAHPERFKGLVKKLNRPLPGDAGAMTPPWYIPGLTRKGICFGCGNGCSRQVYNAEKGRIYKSLCQSSEFYEDALPRGMVSSADTRMLGSRLADGYGLDTSVAAPVLGWLEYCYRTGLLTERATGLALSDMGSEAFIRDVLHKISCREGFGEVLARGVIGAAAAIGPEAAAVLGRFAATFNGEKRDYDPRIALTTALIYALEPRRVINQLHEIAAPIMGWLPWALGDKNARFDSMTFRAAARRMWGSELAADFSTYEGKALAAKMVQDRAYTKESLVVCDLKWTMALSGRTADSITEGQVFSAVTGVDLADEDELYRYGERNFNLQRAIFLRQGWPGREGDRLLDYLFTEPIEKNSIFFNPEVLLPGRDGEIFSRAGMTLDRGAFEAMKTDFYGLRGWDPATGYPTRAKLEELDLKDVADDLAGRGLLA